MKILILNKHYEPHVGGIETVVDQHAEVLSQRHDVTVMACTDYGEAGSCYSKGAFRVEKCHTNFKIFKVPFSWTFFWRILSKRVDIVYLHEPSPFALLCTAFKIRTNLYIYHHSDIVRQRYLKFLLFPIQFFVYFFSKKIFCSSENIAKYSPLLNFFSSKVYVLPFWLDNDISNEKVVCVNNRRDPQYHLFIGRISRYKGVSALVEAIKSCSDHRFVIVGTGEDVHILDEISAHDNVEIIPRHVSEQKKAELFRNALSFLFPSTSENEAFGIMQLEAMSAGVPIINTKLKSGVPEVARDGLEAITIEPNDVPALIDAIEKISDFNTNQTMRRACWIRARSFDKRDLSEKLLVLFDD